MKRSPLLRKTPMKRVSSRRSREAKAYRQKRKLFLAAHPDCMVCWIYNLVAYRATDIHHLGQRGKNYLDETTWLAVCRSCHERIHRNPAAARILGILWK